MSTQAQPEREEGSLEYGRLINSAFNLSWRHKSLWVFGFFAGFGMNTRFDYSQQANESELRKLFSGIENFSMEQIITFFGAALALFAILGLIFFVTSLIASPALVDAVNRLTRGGSYLFSESFSIGVDFFLKFLGLALLQFVIAVAFMLVVIIIGVIAFAIETWLGGLSLLILIPLGMVGFFSIFNIFEIAKRAIVVRGGTIGDALEEGYLLLRRNLGDFFMFFLINLGMMIGFSIAGAMIFGLIAIPVVLMALAGEASLMTSILIGVLVGLPVSLVVGGWSQTFFHSLYTLFYFQLVEPTRPDAAVTATTSG